MWYCNLILKARQLGISTFVSLLFLDRCLFNSNQHAGIIAHTREDAEQLFRRVKFAYDSLPIEIKALRMANTDKARELQLSNGSTLRVGTSMRSSTLQYLHISEFGKICAKYPDKAREIVTGALNAIAPGQSELSINKTKKEKRMSSPARVFDPLRKEVNYEIYPQEGRWDVSMDTKKGPKQWSFQFSHILRVKNPLEPIKKILLPNKTHIETVGRIDKLRGDTLIISDSHNIGDVKAKNVILLSCTLESIEADYITMFQSQITGRKKVNKKINIITTSPTGIESTASFTTTSADSTFSLLFNDKGVWDVRVDKGAISKPKFTVAGQPSKGNVILKGQAKVSEGKSDSDNE